MGEGTICDLPFDNGECEFTLNELIYQESGNYYLHNYADGYPDTFKYAQPVFS